MFSQHQWGRVKRQCEDLLTCIGRIGDGGDGELSEDQAVIQRIIRKITMIMELDGRNIISIAGLQGSGKTTLLKGLYGLGDDILVGTFNRGERLPVLISEAKIDEPQAFRRFLWQDERGNWEIREESIPVQDLKDWAAKEDDTATMLLELRLPYRHLYTGASFLLLPGFEYVQNVHEAIIEFSIRCSGTCIYVVSPNLNAQMEGERLVKTLSGIFENDRTIYALSNSDTRPDYNAAFKETIKEQYGVADSQVVCVGRGDDRWVSQLIAVLETCMNSGICALEARQQYMLDILQSDIWSIRDIANKYAERVKLEMALKEDDYLNALDRELKARKKNIQSHIKQVLKKAEQESVKYLDDNWDKDNKAHPILVWGKRLLNLESKKDFMRLERLLSDAIQKGLYPPDNGSVQRPAFVAGQASMHALAIGTQKAIGTGQRQIHEIELTKADGHNIAVLMSPENSGVELQGSDISRNIEQVADIAAYSFLQMMELAFDDPIRFEPDNGKQRAQSMGISEFLKEGTLNQTAMLSMFGIGSIIDGADGKFDFLDAIANALKVPVPAVSAVIAALTVSNGVLKLVQESCRRDVANFVAAKGYIHNVYGDYAQTYMEAYEEYCKGIRDRMEKKLIRIYGYNRNTVDKLNIYIMLGNLRDTANEISNKLQRQKA